MEKPVPKPSIETEAFWEACNRGELLYQKCGACGQVQFYPRARCAKCHGGEMAWERSQGLGTLHTFSIVHRPPTEAFKPDVPYVLPARRPKNSSPLMSAAFLRDSFPGSSLGFLLCLFSGCC